ncbi:hypothetical protein [Lelliottia nimipressuralis]|uniref:Tail fiber protein n=1 Tax=Lelliottia nimipressuralis TaxID=69220 RepID=A0ABD4KBL7_9ENTR|nr:hypothetical protein [Lelliottia nimipressuralis]MBF4178910.1 hypothetical protein [Lelliottia nimipressuralis]
MPVESATYITDLVPDWPVGASDFVKEGDDHIRGIKKCIQNTLPNMNVAVTMSAAKLNQFDAGWNLAPATTDPAVPSHWQCVNPDTNAVACLQVNSAPTLGINPIDQPYMAVNWADVINYLMPVGHVLMTSKAGNPSTWLGFGTWTERFGYLAASGNVTDTDGVTGSYPLGQGKGYWHPHNSHLFTDAIPLTINDNGQHNHSVTTDIRNDNNGHYGDTGYGGTAATKTYTTADAGQHGHTGTAQLGTATTPLVLPGFGCYVWERTA